MSFAGVSLVGGDHGDGDASRSGWDTAADSSDSGYHLLVVCGYSRTKDDAPNGEFIQSRRFRVGGYQWVIRYYPNGHKNRHTDYMSLYLRLDDDAFVGLVPVQFDFSFIDQVESQELSRLRAMKSCKISREVSWGYPMFIRRSVLEGSKHLKNDSFSIRCDIVVITDANTDQRSSSVVVVSPPPRSLQKHLGSLLQSGEGADVTFEVGGETFMAHRCVLAARSRVFRAELFGPMKEGTTASAVRIDDMEPQVFGLLLNFIYSDSVPELGEYDEEEDDDDDDDDDVMILWQNLLVAADIYDLQKLKLVCEENLYRYVEAKTVASILAQAEQHDCQGLKDACLDFRNSLDTSIFGIYLQELFFGALY